MKTEVTNEIALLVCESLFPEGRELRAIPTDNKDYWSLETFDSIDVVHVKLILSHYNAIIEGAGATGSTTEVTGAMALAVFTALYPFYTVTGVRRCAGHLPTFWRASTEKHGHEDLREDVIFAYYSVHIANVRPAEGVMRDALVSAIGHIKGCHAFINPKGFDPDTFTNDVIELCRAALSSPSYPVTREGKQPDCIYEVLEGGNWKVVTEHQYLSAINNNVHGRIRGNVDSAPPTEGTAPLGLIEAVKDMVAFNPFAPNGPDDVGMLLTPEGRWIEKEKILTLLTSFKAGNTGGGLREAIEKLPRLGFGQFGEDGLQCTVDGDYLQREDVLSLIPNK